MRAKTPYNKKRKRVGCGIGSGHGKRSCRGQKGQGSRSGSSTRSGFEGGQNPLYMRMPKRGFNNKDFKTVFGELNLSDLQAAVDAKKLDAGKEITIETLKAAGLVRPARENVKILGNGELKTALNLVVSKATKSAVAAIEKVKGSVKQLHVEPAPAASA